MPPSAPGGTNLAGTSVAVLASRLLAARNQVQMLSMLEAEARPARTKALATEIRQHVSVLEAHIRGNRGRDAVATLLAMLFLDANHAVSCIRREGALRPSRYDFQGSLLGRIAKTALGIRHLMGALPERVAYLESVVALAKLAPNARVLHDEIVRTIRAHKQVVLKTVLVIVNTLLYRGWLNDPALSSLNTQRYSSEEYAEAASLILKIYGSLFPIDDACCNWIDPSAAGEGAAVYERLLLAAIRLIKFKEAETMVDGLPYRAELDGEAVTISSIDPDVERSVRLGYIQGQGQALIRLQQLQRASDPPVALRALIEKGFQNGAFEHLTELVDEPFRRLRLKLPAVKAVFEMFASDRLFREEVEALLLLDVDNFGSPENMIFQITSHVTSLDLFKVQRFFNFISCVYQKRLESIEDEEERKYLILASTVVVVSHESLLEQLRLIFDDEDKCRQIIALLAMDVGGAYLDLQYRPFVDIGQHYVIAPHIVAASNLVRNTVVANRLRPAAIGTNDRMIQAVVAALRSAGFLVESDFKVRIAGRDSELDIVAWRDDTLFIFEAKNAYHPCSPHEVRNSWDHIRKARDQLDARRSVFGDHSNQAALFSKLKWSAHPGDLYTSIIIANRVFHGAKLGGHPIRQAHELINVLTSGEIVGEDDSFSFWTGVEFETRDLIAYLSGDSVATRQLAALDPQDWEYSLGYRQLVFSSYVLDPDKLDRQMRARYGPARPGGRTAMH